MHPQLNIDPAFYIIPILHLLIGIVNKCWQSLCLFIDEFVELISPVEAKLKQELLELTSELEVINDDIEIEKVNRNMASLEIVNDHKTNEMYLLATENLKLLNNNKKKINEKVKKIRIDIEIEKKKRANEEDAVKNLLYQVLESVKIQKQHFHGGAMNGVCCRHFLDNIDLIFAQIRSITKMRLLRNRHRLNLISSQQLEDVLSQYQLLFEVIDLVFSSLRQVAPTDQEVNTMKEAIKVLETLWSKMDLSYTPKIHILFDHAIFQVCFFKGIADLVEDFIKKSHQIGKKLDHLVAWMSSQSFFQQGLVKIRRKWLQSDPSVENQIELVKNNSK